MTYPRPANEEPTPKTRVVVLGHQTCNGSNHSDNSEHLNKHDSHFQAVGLGSVLAEKRVQGGNWAGLYFWFFQ